MMKKYFSYILAVVAILQLTACNKDQLNESEGTLALTSSVFTVRNLYKGTDILFTPDLASNYLMRGVVNSNTTGKNLPEGWVTMQNTGRNVTRGIALQLTPEEALQFSTGDSVEVDLRGARLSKESGLLLIKELSVTKITRILSGKKITPISLSMKQLSESYFNFESVLLQVNTDLTPTPAPGDIFQGAKPLSDGTTSSEVVLYTMEKAAFAQDQLPERALFTGIAFPFEDAQKNMQLQIRMRTLDDAFAIPRFQVSTYTGNGKGYLNGALSVALFNSPEGMVFDLQGNMIVADRAGHRIRKITPDGIVSNYAGTGTAGYIDGPAATARFSSPWKVALDIDGGILVADRGNQRIRKIATDGTVSTIAGSGVVGLANGPAATAMFNQPSDLTVDKHGNIFVADATNSLIRKITPDGIVSSFAGNGSGFADGSAQEAKFKSPSGIEIDPDGNLYVADRDNNRIRKITPDGIVSTIAGNNAAGGNDGLGTSATFSDPYGITIDQHGNLFVADLVSNKIRQITPTGQVFTIAGNGTTGTADGPGGSAQFNQPTDIVVDALGNIFIADLTNNRIRKIVRL